MNYRNDLIENILPFWMEDAIDKEHGGIMTCLDEEGKLFGEEKSVWFQGRALWTFSKAYNVIDKNPKYLEAAKCIYDFLPKCTDTDGRMFFTVTRDGREIQKRRYYFSECFAAIGCAEYYRATGDEGALENARKYFDVYYECFMGIRKNTPKFNPETVNTVALSPMMMLLSTNQVLREIDTENRAKYEKIGKDSLDTFMKSGLLTERALMESVNADGTFLDTPSGRIVNPGHSMEMAWFIMLEGIMTDNREAIETGKRIIDITLPLGIDKKHGGFISFTDVLGKPAMQLEWDMKLWWPQCEAMIAARLAYILFGDEKYNAVYEELKEYVEKYFVDKKNGEWYGYLHYDNTVSNTLKGNIFKGPFHIPRFYMIMAVLDECGDIKKYM